MVESATGKGYGVFVPVSSRFFVGTLFVGRQVRFLRFYDFQDNKTNYPNDIDRKCRAKMGENEEVADEDIPILGGDELAAGSGYSSASEP